MMYGTVKWFDGKKGYGFITAKEDKKDYFVYFKDINVEGYKNLANGQEVEFETKDTKKGVAAANVTPVGDILPVKNNK